MKNLERIWKNVVFIGDLEYRKWKGKNYFRGHFYIEMEIGSELLISLNKVKF